MLLNEFLKEHRTVQEQGDKLQAQAATIAQLKDAVAKEQATAAQQQTQIEALTATIQKVNDRIELRRPAPGFVAND
jgi:uncharacterized coiled-coil protein SlyX